MADTRLKPIPHPSIISIWAYRRMNGIGQFFSMVRERTSQAKQAIQTYRQAVSAARFAALPKHEQRLITAAAMGCPKEVYRSSLFGYGQHPDRAYWDRRLRDVFPN